MKAALAFVPGALCLPLILSSPAWSQGITITIFEPAAGALAGDNLRVTATVSSLFQLQSVQASVPGHETNLVLLSGFQWTNTLQISDLAWGQQPLTVNARDVFGNTGQVQRAFSHDKPPVLTIIEPITGTVVRDRVRVRAVGTDDGPNGCLLSTGGVSADNFLDTTLLLPAARGLTGVGVTASDFFNPQVGDGRQIYVEPSRLLIEVERVDTPSPPTQPGPFMHVLEDRFLYLDTVGTNMVYKIRDRRSGQETAIPAVTNVLIPEKGYLTAHGAILQFIDPMYFDQGEIMEWRDGVMLDLGPTHPGRQSFHDQFFLLNVKGRFAVWKGDQGLVRRDLEAGTNTLIWPFGVSSFDLAANGDVVFGGGTVWRHRNGTNTMLSSPGAAYYYPLTDGTNVVCQKFAAAIYTSVLLDVGVETPLSTPVAESSPIEKPFPYHYYTAIDGFVAFTSADLAGQLQVYLRSPTGETRQVTFFGTKSTINALGPGGQLIFIHTADGQDRIYYTSFGTYNSVPVDVGLFNLYNTDITDGGRRGFWLGDDYHLRLGRSLFRLSSAYLGSPWFTNGQAGFTMFGKPHLKHTVQATTNFSDWSDVGTITNATGTYDFTDATVAGAPYRFYRTVVSP